MKKILYSFALFLPTAFCNVVEAVQDTIKDRRLICAYVLQMRTQQHPDLEERYILPALNLAGALETALDKAHAKDSLIKRIAYQAWRSRHMNGTLALPSYLQALTVLSDSLIHELVFKDIAHNTEKVLTKKAYEVQQRETIISHWWKQLKNSNS